MTLSEKDIRHIAHLARLQLTDTEVKQYRTELGGILRYVDQLQSLSLKKPTVSKINVEPNYLRQDEVLSWDQSEIDTALKQATHTKDKQIKVKRILE